jgi:hypothetical protein
MGSCRILSPSLPLQHKVLDYQELFSWVGYLFAGIQAHKATNQFNFGVLMQQVYNIAEYGFSKRKIT